MKDQCDSCPHERVHKVEYRLLTQNLDDLRMRVARVESMLGRGILLLVANLAGVAVSIATSFTAS